MLGHCMPFLRGSLKGGGKKVQAPLVSFFKKKTKEDEKKEEEVEAVVEQIDVGEGSLASSSTGGALLAGPTATGADLAVAAEILATEIALDLPQSSPKPAAGADSVVALPAAVSPAASTPEACSQLQQLESTNLASLTTCGAALQDPCSQEPPCQKHGVYAEVAAMLQSMQGLVTPLSRLQPLRSPSAGSFRSESPNEGLMHNDGTDSMESGGCKIASTLEFPDSTTMQAAGPADKLARECSARSALQFQ